MIFIGGGFEEEEDDSILKAAANSLNNSFNNNSGYYLRNSGKNVNSNSGGGNSSNNNSNSTLDFNDDMLVDAFGHNQIYLSKGGGFLKNSRFLIRDLDNDENIGVEDDEFILDSKLFDEIEIEIDQHGDGSGEEGGSGNEGQTTTFKRNKSLLEFTQGYEDPDELEISCEGGSTISSLHRDEIITEFFVPDVDEQVYYNKLKQKQQAQYQQQQQAILALQAQQNSPTQPTLPPTHYSERKINIPSKVRFETPTKKIDTNNTNNNNNINNNSNVNSKINKNNNNNENNIINLNEEKQRKKNLEKERQKKKDKLNRQENNNGRGGEGEEEDIIEESAGEGDGPDDYDENEGGDNQKDDDDDDDEDLIYSFDEIKQCSCFSPYIQILKNRNYSLLWIASLISLCGDWLNEIACLDILATYKLSNFIVSLFLVIRESPPFLFQFITGVVSDKFDRRYVMLVADLVRMVIVLFFLVVRSKGSIWLLFVLAFLQYGTGSFYNPSKSALLPSIVDKKDLITANALDQSSYSSMMLLGASLGGAVTFAFGTNVNFIIDSLTYLASAVCIFLLIKNTNKNGFGNFGNANDEEKGSGDTVNSKQKDTVSLIKNDQVKLNSFSIQDDQDEIDLNESDFISPSQVIKDDNNNNREIGSVDGKKSIGELFKDYFSTYKYGFQYLFANKYIFLIAFAKGSAAIIWSSADMVNISIAKTTFKMGDDNSALPLGIILGAGGLGILMVPLFFARVVKDVPSNFNKVLKTGFFLNSFCTFCLGLSANHFPIYLIFNCFRSASTCIIWMYSSSILQQMLPSEVRGRVFGTEYAILTLFNTCSKILVGVLLDNLLSPKSVLLIFGVFGMVLHFIWVFLFKRFKK